MAIKGRAIHDLLYLLIVQSQLIKLGHFGDRCFRISQQCFAVNRLHPLSPENADEFLEYSLLYKPACRGDLQIGLTEILLVVIPKINEPHFMQYSKLFPRPQPAGNLLPCDGTQKNRKRCMDYECAGLR